MMHLIATAWDMCAFGHTWDGERSLSHVCGDDYESGPFWHSSKDRSLGRSRQHGIQRQHVHLHRTACFLCSLHCSELSPLRNKIPPLADDMSCQIRAALCEACLVFQRISDLKDIPADCPSGLLRP
jgi:hypothetical protein